MAVPKFFPVAIGDVGPHVEGYGRAMARENGALLVYNALPKATRRKWAWWHKRAANKIKRAEGWVEDGKWNKKLYYRLIDDGAFDAKATALVNSYAPPAVPDIGPVVPGSGSILDFDFTHMTTGLGWPAFDTALTGDPGPSLRVIAAEDMVIDTKDSSASPGEAFYATGKSGIRYWYAHLKDDHPLGKRFAKGEVVGDTLPTTVGGGTHLHLAINLVPVTGRHARYGANGDGPNYTHGPYTLRTELLR
jgi:hypothetical protein